VLNPCLEFVPIRMQEGRQSDWHKDEPLVGSRPFCPFFDWTPDAMDLA
jgi:hypothetical protein